MNEKISILIPIYNVPVEYLRNCLNSAINQTYDNVEVIAVDDGSTTDCIEQCKDLLENHKVKFIHQENKGLSGARNTAYRNATGKYIMFLDGDDYLDVATCEKLISICEKENLDVLLFDVYSHGNKDVEKNSFEEKEKNFYDDETNLFLQKRVLNFNGKVSQTFARIIRRDLLVENNIEHIEECKQGAEGLVFNLILFNYTKRVKYLHLPLYYYQYNEGSISHKLSENNICLTLLCFEKMKDLLISWNKFDDFKSIFYERFSYVILTSLISGYFNPDNKIKYKEAKNKATELKKNEEVKYVLDNKVYKKLDFTRRLTSTFYKFNWYLPIKMIAKIRNKQYKSK